VIHAYIRRAPLILAIVLLLAGCASESTRPSSVEGEKGTTASSPANSGPVNKVVEQRALQRWDLLINHQAEKAYDYLSPGFRATKKREDYATEMNNRPVKWSKVLPYRQNCAKPDVCILDLQIDANIKMPGVGEVSSLGFVKETWIKSQGKWFFVPEGQKGAGGK